MEHHVAYCGMYATPHATHYVADTTDTSPDTCKRETPTPTNGTRKIGKQRARRVKGTTFARQIIFTEDY